MVAEVGEEPAEPLGVGLIVDEHVAAGDRLARDRGWVRLRDVVEARQLGTEADVPFGGHAQPLRIVDEGRTDPLVEHAVGWRHHDRRVGVAADLDRRHGRHIVAAVGLHARLHHLVVVELVGRVEPHHEVHVVVLIERRVALAVVAADAEDAVVTRALEPLVEHILIEILGILGRPVVEDTQATFALRGIDEVSTVEGQTIGAGLHVVPAVRHLRLADADTVHLVGGDVAVGVAVTELSVVDRSRIAHAREARGEVGLDVHVEAVADVTGENQTDAAEEKVVVRPHRLVTGRIGAGLVLVVPERAVDPHLGVTADVNLLIPLFFAGVVTAAFRLLVDRLDGGILNTGHSPPKLVHEGVVVRADGAATAGPRAVGHLVDRLDGRVADLRQGHRRIEVDTRRRRVFLFGGFFHECRKLHRRHRRADEGGHQPDCQPGCQRGRAIESHSVSQRTPETRRHAETSGGVGHPSGSQCLRNRYKPFDRSIPTSNCIRFCGLRRI